VRIYTVQSGDTPSSIAARDDMAGCPKCAKDLVEANTHRASVRHVNGYLTFAEPLVAGENLWLPDKWFDGTLDRMPRSYFDNLPKVPAGLGELPPESAADLAMMARRWSKLTERKPTRENHLTAASAHRAAGDAFFLGRGGPIAKRHYETAREHEALAAAFTGLGQLPEQHEETTIMNNQQQPSNAPAYALAVRPQYGVGGVPYGQPYGPYGISYGLAQAAPAAPAPPSAGFLASLPSWWPIAGLAVGGVLALTGIVLMASAK
jgi:hypothetical protein